MEQPTQVSFLVHLAALRDLRQVAKGLYPLTEILLPVLCSTIAGADDFTEIGLWGAEHLTFLRRFLPFQHSTAAATTSSR
jgi:hypothetical protein